MPWLGIWFESLAGEGGARSPEHFRGLAPPVVYPYARNFVEEEGKRLVRSSDPGRLLRDRERFQVYYSLHHDSVETGIDRQGCSILGWLFRHFETDSRSTLSARFSEIPIVIHCEDAARAAAMANALALLRFLSASEDQAIAKILVHPWNPFRGSPALAAADYERRVIEFLHGEIFYPEDVTLFDVLGRNDLKAHRTLEPCCLTQIGFVGPLLEWVDECWPQSAAEGVELLAKLRSSLADESRYLRRRERAG
ncbi:MAG TPA: hypothetical protein VFD71_13760 [Planctomycetota bacterium]|nr:hypothetical protein [Planctomycetota bacterium]